MDWLTLPNLYLLLFFVGLGMTLTMFLLGLGHGIAHLGHHEFGHHDFGHHDVGHHAGGHHNFGHHASGYHELAPTHHHGATSHGAHHHHEVATGHGHLAQDLLYWLSVLFSPTMLSIFLTMFGGIGYLCSQTPLLRTPALNIPLSLFAALFAVFGVFVPLRRWMARWEATSHPTMHDLIGLIGESLSPIPPNGFGTIAYEFKGIRRTAPARNRTDKAIKRGAPVRIIDVVGNMLVVESAEERLEVWEKL
jgi:membrane protein implicated in regulation of membrane protease activity